MDCWARSISSSVRITAAPVPRYPFLESSGHLVSLQPHLGELRAWRLLELDRWMLSSAVWTLSVLDSDEEKATQARRPVPHGSQESYTWTFYVGSYINLDQMKSIWKIQPAVGLSLLGQPGWMPA